MLEPQLGNDTVTFYCPPLNCWTDWLSDRQTGWETDRLKNCWTEHADRLNRLTRWLTDWLSDGLTEWLTERLTDELTAIDSLALSDNAFKTTALADWRNTYRLTNRQTDWVTVTDYEYLTDWLTNWQTDWLIDWLSFASLSDFKYSVLLRIKHKKRLFIDL